ncbi:hypothetical protein CTM93_19740 [Photobacterium phosphoreum]|uniref:hypothetical protein n=1 Tax=Photobacterium phosphoreum TaxID=659 RepID=UPI000D180E59|nr:hypothetical protein [Photobacterium phosphoreum]PSU75706.1 hypothetical protein CTM93_19740 [Photobacterium phosphoreum]
MKLYFLVEGISSEMQVYPKWIQYFMPKIIEHKDFESFKHSNSGFYLVSGMGYPSILNHIGNAVSDIFDIEDVDYLYIILDCDEDDLNKRLNIINDELNKHTFPERLNVQVIIQKRCFETILLANNMVMPRNPKTSPLIEYLKYYNVIDNDPENMGHYNDDYTHSQFHTEYAIKALRDKKIRYTKSNCSSVTNNDYIQKIEQRVASTPHLKSFKLFIDSLKAINEKMSQP